MKPHIHSQFTALKTKIDRNYRQRLHLLNTQNTLIAEHQAAEGLLVKPRIESIWNQL